MRSLVVLNLRLGSVFSCGIINQKKAQLGRGLHEFKYTAFPIELIKTYYSSNSNYKIEI